jgi:hypothetical protein
MRLVGNEACMGEVRTVYKISAEKSERKRSLWRSVNERKMNRCILKEIKFEDVD